MNDTSTPMAATVSDNLARFFAGGGAGAHLHAMGMLDVSCARCGDRYRVQPSSLQLRDLLRVLRRFRDRHAKCEVR